MLVKKCRNNRRKKEGEKTRVAEGKNNGCCIYGMGR